MEEQQKGPTLGYGSTAVEVSQPAGTLVTQHFDAPPANPQTGLAIKPKSQALSFVERFRFLLIAILLVLLLGGALVVWLRAGVQPVVTTSAGDFESTRLPLESLGLSEIISNAQTVTVEGQLQVNRSVVLTPSTQPIVPTTGELYYDTNTNQLTYYNGTEFLGLISSAETLQQTTTTTTNIFNTTSNTSTAGITTSGGTTNRLPKFTGVQSQGDSLASDKGTYLELDGGLNIKAETTIADFSLWNSSTTPTNPNFVDIGGPVELGMKFKTDVAGTIKGLRFYRGTSSAGPYVGSLWSNTGALLARATFSATSLGWQEITFSTPVTISPDTTYIASYHTEGGGYATDPGFFGTGGVDVGPLHALADGLDGGNGVFRYSGTPVFPTQTSGSSNYWIDVVFSGSTFTDDSRIRVNGAQLSTNDLGNDFNIAKRSSSQVFSGHNIFRKASNSDNAFEIQRADTTKLFSIDTLNSRVVIGPIDGSSSGVLLVLNRKTGATDPPGINGAMYYQNDLHMFRCYRDGEWSECGEITPARSFALYDEFMGGYNTSFASNNIGNLGWSAQAIGANGTLSFNPATPTPVADRPGVLALQTPAVLNQGTTFTLADSTAASMIIGTGNSLRTSVAVGSTNQVLRVGIHNQTTTTTQPVSGVWWEADPSANANWRYCFGNGTTATCANSNVAIAANTWVRLEIRVLTTGTGTSSASFIINGGGAATVSSVTIDTTTRLSPAYSCYATTAAAQDCYWDYFQLHGTTSASR